LKKPGPAARRWITQRSAAPNQLRKDSLCAEACAAAVKKQGRVFPRRGYAAEITAFLGGVRVD